jgi:hypothetical protein
MGDKLSDVPSNFDEYINENEQHYPPMIVFIYKDGVLQEIFDAPSGFDLNKFTTRNNNPRKISISSFGLIDQDGQQELDVNANGKRYIGIYKIDSNLNHYISKKLKGTLPMIVYFEKYHNIVNVFETP